MIRYDWNVPGLKQRLVVFVILMIKNFVRVSDNNCFSFEGFFVKKLKEKFKFR